jgi:serine/threonine protein kinase
VASLSGAAPDLAALVDVLLAPSPEERPGSASLVALKLGEILRGLPASDTGPIARLYDVERTLVSYQVGSTFLARRRAGGKRVCVDVTEADLPESYSLQRLELQQGLVHPHLQTLLAHVEADRRHIFEAEPCETTLDGLVASQGPLAWRRALSLVADALGALVYLHERGIVHRIVQPLAIFVESHVTREWARLGGLWFAYHPKRHAAFEDLDRLVGTPPFMSPEHPRSFSRLEPVSDVWSMGATLYFALTGHPPQAVKPEADMVDVLTATMKGRLTPVRDRAPALPAAVADVVDRALAVDTAGRFASSRDMLEAVERARAVD